MSSGNEPNGDVGEREKVLPVASEAETPGQKTERSTKGIKWFLLVVGILSSAFLFALDNSIVADVQPQIIETYPGSIDKLPWLSVAFALGAASTTLVWASLFGSFDYKPLYLIALVLFEIGSALCGSANLMDVLIFGRALAGLGGAGLYLGVLTLLSALTTASERPVYVASTGLVWGLGSVLGPVIGGAFAESSATWRWAFYINLVIGGLFAPVYLFMIPSVDPRPEQRTVQKAAAFDYAGSFLIIAAFSLGTVGLSFGGSLFEWRSATIITTLCLSGLLFVLFGIQQCFCLFTNLEHRLLPVQYFKSRTLVLLFVQSAASGAPIFVPVYFIPLFFQFTRGDGALDAAVRLLPFVCFLVFFSLANGAIMGKEGHYAPWYIGASIFIIIGSALMYTVNETTSTARIYGYSILLASGAGCIVQIGFIVAQAVVPRSEMSAAVAFINLAQISGLVIALTLANTIFLNDAQIQIANILPNASPDEIDSAISASRSAFLQSLSRDVQQQILHAIVVSISKTYILCMTSGALILVLAFGLKWERVFLVM
ncbi:hypothetical protein EPUS_07120 [Endocarpon pusillum Z07020]|uniref:Major facilitator superfamily (MFS) profile domain-containing protein n=1 Tax=Endocarpon pusillum (strain Z07020 / HMAS-L-300199) TaxID=1263415 RepID=U1GM91_ENDPU|nr:uncharacterized protein EPUS_07120 [Endocarpon pusillum Z07020]ERF73026.1 hypothetical protein EPUS_07120 [Endocarpon pusillum Z07020]